MTIEVYQRGETIPIWAVNKTWAGVLTDPEDGIVITLWKPDGTLAAVGETEIEDTAMSRESVPVTGYYIYHYDSASNDPKGWWHYQLTAVDGTDPNQRTTITHGSFKLN